MSPAVYRRLPCLAALAGLACALPLLSRAERPKAPRAITNSIGMRLVMIPAGKFTMGSPENEPDREPAKDRNTRSRWLSRSPCRNSK